jgi:hypothetical protein
MLSRRAYLLTWTLAIGVPLGLVLWAFVPALQPNMGAFLYWPSVWYWRFALLAGAIALSLGIGYAYGRARWAGRQR